MFADRTALDVFRLCLLAPATPLHLRPLPPITKEEVFARLAKGGCSGVQHPSLKPLGQSAENEIGTAWDSYADVPADVDVPAAR